MLERRRQRMINERQRINRRRQTFDIERRCEMWKLVCPIQGDWYHIMNLLQVGEIYQYLLENFSKVRIRMLINDGNTLKVIRFKTRAKVEWFHALAKSSCGTGRFKVRIKEKAP